MQGTAGRQLGAMAAAGSGGGGGGECRRCEAQAAREAGLQRALAHAQARAVSAVRQAARAKAQLEARIEADADFRARARRVEEREAELQSHHGGLRHEVKELRFQVKGLAADLADKHAALRKAKLEANARLARLVRTLEDTEAAAEDRAEAVQAAARALRASVMDLRRHLGVKGFHAVNSHTARRLMDHLWDAATKLCSASGIPDSAESSTPTASSRRRQGRRLPQAAADRPDRSPGLQSTPYAGRKPSLDHAEFPQSSSAHRCACQNARSSRSTRRRELLFPSDHSSSECGSDPGGRTAEHPGARGQHRLGTDSDQDGGGATLDPSSSPDRVRQRVGHRANRLMHVKRLADRARLAIAASNGTLQVLGSSSRDETYDALHELVELCQELEADNLKLRAKSEKLRTRSQAIKSAGALVPKYRFAIVDLRSKVKSLQTAMQRLETENCELREATKASQTTARALKSTAGERDEVKRDLKNVRLQLDQAQRELERLRRGERDRRAMLESIRNEQKSFSARRTSTPKSAATSDTQPSAAQSFTAEARDGAQPKRRSAIPSERGPVSPSGDRLKLDTSLAFDELADLTLTMHYGAPNLHRHPGLPTVRQPGSSDAQQLGSLITPVPGFSDEELGLTSPAFGTDQHEEELKVPGPSFVPSLGEAVDGSFDAVIDGFGADTALYGFTDPALGQDVLESNPPESPADLQDDLLTLNREIAALQASLANAENLSP